MSGGAGDGGRGRGWWLQGYSLEMMSGMRGSKLSHSHATHFTLVLQSLNLWRQVLLPIRACSEAALRFPLRPMGTCNASPPVRHRGRRLTFCCARAMSRHGSRVVQQCLIRRSLKRRRRSCMRHCSDLPWGGC
jgi:hypothetical protein